MGKKLIILGADFSQNGVESPVNIFTTHLRDGHYSGAGVFEANGQGGFYGWSASNEMSVLSGQNASIILKASARFRVTKDGVLVQESFYSPGNYNIPIVGDGKLIFNFKTGETSNPATSLPTVSTSLASLTEVYIY